MFLTRDASFDETLRFQRPDSLGPKIFSYFLLTPGGKPLLLSDPFYFQFVNDRKIPIRWRQAGRGKTRNSPFCSQLFQTSEGIFCLSRFQTESKRKISQTSVYRYSGPVFDMQRFFNRLDCREKGNFEPRACPRVEKLIVEQQERIWKMALNDFYSDYYHSFNNDVQIRHCRSCDRYASYIRVRVSCWVQGSIFVYPNSQLIGLWWRAAFALSFEQNWGQYRLSMGGVKEKGVADHIRLDQGGNQFEMLRHEILGWPSVRSLDFKRSFWAWWMTYVEIDVMMADWGHHPKLAISVTFFYTRGPCPGRRLKSRLIGPSIMSSWGDAHRRDSVGYECEPPSHPSANVATQRIRAERETRTERVIGRIARLTSVRVGWSDSYLEKLWKLAIGPQA